MQRLYEYEVCQVMLINFENLLSSTTPNFHFITWRQKLDLKVTSRHLATKLSNKLDALKMEIWKIISKQQNMQVFQDFVSTWRELCKFFSKERLFYQGRRERDTIKKNADFRGSSVQLLWEVMGVAQIRFYALIIWFMSEDSDKRFRGRNKYAQISAPLWTE